VDRVPRGASFTMVSDSCHSGGLIDSEKEQIGPSVAHHHLPAAARVASTTTTKARFIPYAALVDHLAGVSGVDASHHAADHLLALFGADTSATFHGPRRHRPAAARPDAGILLSGCQTDETSADVEGSSGSGKACGAFSNAVQAVLAAHPAPMSNREVVRGARAALAEQGFRQHPCLYCSDDNADAPFLYQNAKEEKAMPEL
jgi:metacaspase-1